MRLIDADTLKYALGSSDAEIYIDGLIDEMPTIDASVWTPCAERLPVPDDDNRSCSLYIIYVERYDEIFPQVAIYLKTLDGAEWKTIEGYKHRYPAVAWQLLHPYNPDHIRDTTKKADHIVDNKKMEEPRSKHTLEMAQAGLSGFVKE